MRGTKTEWGGKGSGKWRLRVYVGDDERGRPIQRSRNFTGGARVAEDALRELIDKVMASRHQTKKATVAGLLEEWLEAIRPEVSGYTYKTYRSYINKRLIPDLGKVRLDDLTAYQLDRAYRRWGKTLAPATVRKHHNILSAALGQAVKWEWIASNPAAKARPPSGRTTLTRTISSDDVRRIVEAANTPTEKRPDGDQVLAMAVAFAALTGCRRGELCALRWSDVNLSATLTVSRSLTALDKKVTVGATKTHQTRRMLLDTTALDLLERWRGWQEAQAARAEVTLDPDPFLLSLAPNGSKPLLPATLSHRFHDLMVVLGMPYHFHELRHFAATAMIAGGVNVRTVATRLGHSTPSLTLSTYAHAVEAADQGAADLLGTILGPAASKMLGGGAV